LTSPPEGDHHALGAAPRNFHQLRDTTATSIKARLILTGMNVDPDEISRVIGLTPTKTWRRGEQRARSDLRWEHDGWMLSTSEQASLDLEAEIQKLLGNIRTTSRKSIAHGSSANLPLK
jgi:hypothetical protein